MIALIKSDLSTTFFVISAVSMIVQYIMIKIMEDESTQEAGSYYKIILKIKSKHKLVGSVIQILFFISLASLFAMLSLTYLK